MSEEYKPTIWSRVPIPVFILLFLLLLPLALPIVLIDSLIVELKYKFKSCPSCGSSRLKAVGCTHPPVTNVLVRYRRVGVKTFYICEDCGSYWKHSYGKHPEPASPDDLEKMYKLEDAAI